MKNNFFVLLGAIFLGLSFGVYFPDSKIAYIFFNILRGIH